MQLISVDIGHYSVKFLNFKLDKKKVILLSTKEVVIDQDEYNVLAENIEWDLKLKIVKEYLNEIDDDYRVIMNTPSEITTTRFLDLPIKNKKKASLMIPFQLEEDLPFGLQHSHISHAIRVKGEQSQALVSITPKEEFRPFYDKIIEFNIQPKIVTTEESIYQHYVSQTEEILPQAFCILDMGHHTIKAYFYFNNELVAVHRSYVAGRVINEVIAENYKINMEEASLYKHQNCFFLTSGQYETVNENQRTFAQLMDKAMMPFIHEFKRWEIGFRIKNGIGISDIYITGGTSNIKNVNNYLTEQLQTKVGYLNTFLGNVNADRIDEDLKLRRKFSYSNIQAIGYAEKSQITNFLKEEFSIQGQIDLPLESFSFIGVRLAAITMLLFFSLALERVFLYRDINNTDKTLTSLAKNSALELTNRQKRLITTQPETIQRELKRKQKVITQEVQTLQSSAQTNALASLEVIATLVSDLDVEILQFQSLSGGDFNALFLAKNANELTKLDDIFQTSGIKNIFTDKNLSKLTLSVSGSEK